MNKLKQTLEKILKQEESFIDSETKELNYNKVKDSADKIDKKLITILAENKETKDKFFTKIKDVYVFNINDFKFFLDENKVNNSYTKYANLIGLSDGTELLKNETNIVLDFPFKDCVLEGGQSTDEGTEVYFEYSEKDKKYKKEETQRNEVFFNQILAHDEIDRLFDKKALADWKRFTKESSKNGELIKDIKRNKNGLIEENLVIKGNNLLALHCLKSEFTGKIKLIYVDPPYNTEGDADTFVYNNNFKHSSWLTFIKNRLEIAKEMLKEDGFIAITIDHFELFYLGTLADEIFGRENRLGIISVVIRPQGRQFAKFFSATTEYMLVYAKNEKIAKFNGVILDDNKKLEYIESDEKGFFKYEPLMYSRFVEEKLKKGDKYYYPIYVNKNLEEITLEKKQGFIEILPINKKRKIAWRVQKDKFMQFLEERPEDFTAIKDKTGNIQIFEKYREDDGTKIKTHWIGKRYNATTSGTGVLKDIFGTKIFSYPKSLYAVLDTIKIMTNDNDIILDFFAGSGTTGHAVIELNKEKKSNRKFILIEQMEYIETVIIPRIKEVLRRNDSKDSFIYFELAKWNEQAKEEINEAKDLKTLEKMFDNLYEKYFLNYNLKIKEFKEKIIKEENFKKLTLNEQKKMFLIMLDLNQMYIQESEMSDKQFGISKEDQKLTKEFYQSK
ncbi:hypothetical protein COX93_02650 [Candidatus Nomurabacteria bacterium CG_4_10_14_0_2_um_filter_30_12]|uniref:Site-specific DNA-methyltransferase n=2 Tax=Candidatus Nomuraibacteriota TaxID=1752729 RepID=A0A2J0MF95_9BACT|nr:MAG: hypothetical protein COU48_00015 [Candidatus Nomurabacteria bacterium CG10_big_fil_rev_8_21_14_0_10_03_31_7]PIZ86963.1 MAG: hypothetical protein COX93_02650 [Candidatus Nomurabacteria bacterium CG_4_10_14_0_2_um_filter_30_12]